MQDLMTQREKRLYLIETLQREMPQYGNVRIPEDEMEQKQLLRSLFNVRPPYPAAQEFLSIQDVYLSEEIDRRGVVDAESFVPVNGDERICIWQGDITRLKVDAIVNAANSALLGCWAPCHSCIDNMIHTFSGVQLRIRCSEIMQEQGHEEETGTAKITPAYNLPCRHVIHTVGPIIRGMLRKRDCDLLASCYRSCLELAAESGCKSIAFCCISTGEFHFPNRRAAEIAVDTVKEFLQRNTSIERVVFNVFKDTDLAIYQKLLGEE